MSNCFARTDRPCSRRGSLLSDSAVMLCLLQVVALARDQIAAQFIDRLDWIRVCHLCVVMMMIPDTLTC